MSWSYRPGLDGLRTVAVYSVLLFHTGHPWAEGGFIGVDLFFVLSGFLVTSVLISEISDTGSLRIGHFYARRVRRLLPAAAVVIVATSAVFVLVTSVVRRVSMVEDAQSALLYFANWHFMSSAGDYFATDVDKSPFLHFWSLSIEEQYYIAFPLLLLLLTRAGKRWRLGVLTGLMLASIGSQLYWAQVDTNHAYYGTDARFYQLLAGSLLALTITQLAARTPRVRWGGLAVVSLVGFLVLCSGLVPMTPSWRGIAAMVVSVALVGSLMLADTSPTSRLLSRPVPVFLGKISYGTYLWHWPVILVLEEVFATSPRVVAVLTVALSTGLAAASYEVLEMPIRRSSALNRLNWTPAVVGVAASAVLAVTVVPGLLHLDRRPALATNQNGNGQALAGKRIEIPQDIDWQQVVDDHGKTGTCPADQPSKCTVVEGSGTHVLLLGDSQMQSLVPMFERLAKEHDLTLSLNVVPGCPWQQGLTNSEMAPSTAETCKKSRVDWYEKALPELDPDVVIVLTRSRDTEHWEGIVTRRDGKDQPLDKAIYDTTRQTLRKITSVVPHTLLVDSLVVPETFDPADCLASATDGRECVAPVPLGVSPSDAFYESAAVKSPKVDTLDLNPAFCPDAPVCRPIVDGEVVWRDDHHVTASFATSRREQVWKLLQQTDAFEG